MTKRATKAAKPELPSLTESRKSARQKIQTRIEKGRQLRDRAINNVAELKKAYEGWSKYNSELLLRLFSTTAIADEYNEPLNRPIYFVMADEYSLAEFQYETAEAISRLESIRERLNLFPEPSRQSASQKVAPLGQDVFVVHGHDEATKEAVARFIEHLKLKAIVLHEQPNMGRTVIEKFEAYANVGFAVVLLTPDDVGAAQAKKDELRPRARQNVIFELGYFIAKLGRERVCPLYKEGVELPSDYLGVLYTQIDTAGAWRFALAKEMKKAGLPVDLNDI